ncbi:MAG: hypothetical protein JWP96_933 [Polaromonas sp.]|nr:hypothetical protein [Polaromonas sp.]
MKKLLLFFAMLGLALAGQAQPTLSQTPLPEASKAYPVDSPNRTRSSEMATATKPDKHMRRHTDRRDALVWVDAMGKTVGRFSGENSMVVPYNNQLALLLGLTALDCPSPRLCTSYLGGARWNKDYTLLYASSDCSGQAYSAASTPATPYVGIPILDGETTYLYFFRLAEMGYVMLKSSFFNNQCTASQQGSSVFVAPSVGVIPAATIGAEPFTVK